MHRFHAFRLRRSEFQKIQKGQVKPGAQTVFSFPFPQTAAEGEMHYLWCVNITPTQCERHYTEMHLICVTTEINEFTNIWMNLNVNGVLWSLSGDRRLILQPMKLNFNERIQGQTHVISSSRRTRRDSGVRCRNAVLYTHILYLHVSERFIRTETTGKCIVCGNKYIWCFILSLVHNALQQRWGFTDGTAAPDWSAANGNSLK